MPDVHQLLMKSQTISPPRCSDPQPAGPAGSITPKTASNRSLQLFHRPLLPQTLLSPCSSCSRVSLLLWRALHYSLLESQPIQPGATGAHNKEIIPSGALWLVPNQPSRLQLGEENHSPKTEEKSTLQ